MNQSSLPSSKITLDILNYSPWHSICGQFILTILISSFLIFKHNHNIHHNPGENHRCAQKSKWQLISSLSSLTQCQEGTLQVQILGMACQLHHIQSQAQFLIQNLSVTKQKEVHIFQKFQATKPVTKMSQICHIYCKASNYSCIIKIFSYLYLQLLTAPIVNLSNILLSRSFHEKLKYEIASCATGCNCHLTLLVFCGFVGG